MKFWGNMAHLRPGEVLLQHPAIVSSLADMLHTEDITAQTVALETLGYSSLSKLTTLQRELNEGISESVWRGRQLYWTVGTC